MKTIVRMKENLKGIGRWNLFVITLLIAMWNIFPIFYSYINKGLTDTLLEKNWTFVILLTGIQIFLWVISTLLNSYEQNIRQKSMTRAETQTKLMIRKKLCSLPICFFEKPDTLQLLSKANENDAVYFMTYKNIAGLCIMVPSIIVAMIPLVPG